MALGKKDVGGASAKGHYWEVWDLAGVGVCPSGSGAWRCRYALSMTR